MQELIETVGLKPDHIRRYPHEFSGGQRQRIGIARTLALRPEFIVCDEPISALDVSIQAQVINLLEKLQRERGFSYLFIAHDLEMVYHISHKIGVMYLGNMVELGSSDDVYKKPLHPYTRALISAAPIADPHLAKEKKRIILEGEVPSPLNPPAGCPFARFADGSHAAEVRIEGQSITAFSLRLRRYTLTERDSLLLPLALSRAIAQRYPGCELTVAYIDSYDDSVGASWIAD